MHEAGEVAAARKKEKKRRGGKKKTLRIFFNILAGEHPASSTINAEIKGGGSVGRECKRASREHCSRLANETTKSESDRRPLPMMIKSDTSEMESSTARGSVYLISDLAARRDRSDEIP